MANRYIKRCSTSLISVQFCSVAPSCLTLCDPMNLSTPGLPVHHQFPEFREMQIKNHYEISPYTLERLYKKGKKC